MTRRFFVRFSNLRTRMIATDGQTNKRTVLSNLNQNALKILSGLTLVFALLYGPSCLASEVDSSIFTLLTVDEIAIVLEDFDDSACMDIIHKASELAAASRMTEAIVIYEFLVQELGKHQSSECLHYALDALVVVHGFSGDAQRIVDLCDQILNLEHIDSFSMAEAYVEAAGAQIRLGRFADANASLIKCLAINNGISDSIIAFQANHELALLRSRSAEYVEALRQLFASLHIAEAEQSPTLICKTKSRIARIFTRLAMYTRAEKYADEAIRLAHQSNLQVFGAQYVMAKIDIMMKRGQLPEAAILLDSCESIFARRNLMPDLVEVYLQKARIALAQKEIDTAKVLINNINESSAMLRDPYLRIQNRIAVASLMDQVGQQLRAAAIYRDVVMESTKLSFHPFRVEALGWLSDYARGQNNFAEADALNQERETIENQYLSPTSFELIAQIEEDFSSRQHAQQMDALTSQEDRRIANQQRTIALLLVALSGLGLILYFMMKRYRTKHRDDQEDQDGRIQEIDDLLANIEKTRLQALFEGQENERARIAKELHDGLGGLLAISHSQLKNLDKEGSDISEARQLVGSAYEELRRISHNLMPGELSRFGLKITLENMVAVVDRVHAFNIELNLENVPEEVDNQLGLAIYRIVQEAICNIIKYAAPEDVLIQLIGHEKMISLTIEDDGVGFKAEPRKGFGLQAMKDRAEALGGSFEIESKPGVGTTILISLPFGSAAAQHIPRKRMA